MANEKIPASAATPAAAGAAATTKAAILPQAAAASAGTAVFLNPNLLGIVKTVDVGDTPVIPQIVRGGVQLTPPILNPQKVDNFIGTLGPIARPSLPRVLSQSIDPGTRVQKGTPVNIVLVPVSDIGFNILDGIHQDLQNRSIADVLPLVADPQVSAILNAHPDATTLSDADKSALTQKLAGINVGVSDAAAATSLATAFSSLKMAQAFA